MIQLLQILDKYIFTGVPSQLVIDLIKVVWEQSTKRTWEQLYFDAFNDALNIETSQVERSTYIKQNYHKFTFTQDEIYRVLHQNLHIDVSTMPLSSLSEEKFVEVLTSALANENVFVIGENNLSYEDYTSLIRNFIIKATAIFKASVERNKDTIQKALLREALNNRSLLEETKLYLEAQFNFVFVKMDSHFTLIEQIYNNTELIKNSLGLNRSKPEIHDEIQSTIKARLPKIFSEGGLCQGKPVYPAMDQFFVGQEFSSDKDDLLLALSDAFREFNIKPYRADQDIEPGHIICKIAEKIQSTLFSIFELTRSKNRNVYLELGIAIGLERPFVLVKDEDADVSFLVQGLNYYCVHSYSGLKRELGNQLHNYLLKITHYYSPTVIPLCSSDISNTYVLAHGDYNMPVDFCLSVAESISNYGLTPVILGSDNAEVTKAFESAMVPYSCINHNEGTILDASVEAIKKARFCIFRIDKECSPDVFLLLGIAIGLGRPWRILNRKGSSLPSDLQGLSNLEFQSFEYLKSKILSTVFNLI
jgi:hypothetical protein